MSASACTTSRSSRWAPNARDGAHGEILIRMLDEAGRIVLPGAFLPAAERYGLMLAIDRWVVSKKPGGRCPPRRISGADVTFAINISGQSLGAADFLDFVTEQIDATQVAPSRLCFEITETSAVSELAHALRFIDTLKARWMPDSRWTISAPACLRSAI